MCFYFKKEKVTGIKKSNMDHLLIKLLFKFWKRNSQEEWVDCIYSIPKTWIFLKNNYKSETMLLVRQRFKLFSFLTIRVQRTWFCYLKMHLEIEYEKLEFENRVWVDFAIWECTWKSSVRNSSLKIECLTLDFQVHFQMAKSSPLDSNC